MDKDNSEIVNKLEEISGISNRRYMPDDMVSSDMAANAGRLAIADAGIDAESLDYIVVAHNVGDVSEPGNPHTDIIPSLASRVKAKLGIKNPETVAYDLIFGCPGWLEAIIQISYVLRSGDASKALVIGSESLSRVCDPHDRDSMLFSDGAGATILETRDNDEKEGLIAHKTHSDALEYNHLLYMGDSCNPGHHNKNIYIRMNGRKLYEYAVTHLPPLVTELLKKAEVDVRKIKKVLIHQANEKMDEAIVARVFKMAGIRPMPEGIMPMVIREIGNNSVATIPIMMDMILKDQLEGHQINAGDYVLFTSVGAGMNINAALYKFPQ